jgi:excisionase family DNA binding protein
VAETDVAESEARFIQIGEAATLCGLSRTVLRRMVAEGRLRAWRTPGRHLRFAQSDCLEFSRSLGRIDVVGDAVDLVGQVTLTSPAPVDR